MATSGVAGRYQAGGRPPGAATGGKSAGQRPSWCNPTPKRRIDGSRRHGDPVSIRLVYLRSIAGRLLPQTHGFKGLGVVEVRVHADHHSVFHLGDLCELPREWDAAALTTRRELCKQDDAVA
jgi:hypothetical protein